MNKICAQYKEFKDGGMTQEQATKALMRSGVDFDAAVDACWKVETGKYAPTGSVYGGDDAAAFARHAPDNRE